MAQQGSPVLSETTRAESDIVPSKQSDSNVALSDRPASEKEQVLIVDWDGPDDPQNPRNWAPRKKWAATVIVSLFVFITPASSSMIAPASNQVASFFHITNSVVVQLTTSIFVLAYAFGPLFIAPMSELFGRSRVLQLANLWYLVFNLSCGFAKTETQLIVLRFMAGLGGGAPLAIGGAVISDIFAPEQRGKAMGLYSIAPMMGPVLGPMTGAWVAQKSTWKWVFWSTSIVDAVIQGFGLFFLVETYAPILLKRKAAKIRKSMKDHEGRGHAPMIVRTIFDGQTKPWKTLFKDALVRPFVFGVVEPVIQLFGLYIAFIYGLLYLFLTSMPTMFQGVYHEKVGISGLHYLALGIGLIIGSQISARVMDKLYVHLKKKAGNVRKPEFRLPPMVPGTFMIPIGLLITGWTVEHKTHWIGPDIGLALFAGGAVVVYQGVQTYTLDCYALHAASALAAMNFMRSLLGFSFPLFAPYMYKSLGYGKADTILAALAIAIGCPAPWLFWKYGESIRRRSKFAFKS